MKETILADETISSLCMSLSHLIHAGIGTGDALALLCEDEQDPVCKKLLQDMAVLGDDGISLAAIFQKTGRFPAYVCTLLTVGEQVGKTEETLTALAQYYIRREQMRRQIRSSLLYPAMLLGVLLAVMVILLVWVLPVFDDVYAQLGSRLTGLAGSLLTFGTVLGKLLPFLCAGLVLIAAVFAVPPVRKGFLAYWRKYRGDKGVAQDLNSARFVQALSMAVSSGMTDQEAVCMAASLSLDQSPGFCARCAACLTALDNGSTLAQALQKTGFFSPAQRRLLEAGVHSGRSEQVLETLSLDLTEDSQQKLYRIIGKIEPAMIAVSCVLIGLVLLSVMLPLMDIMNTIG